MNLLKLLMLAALLYAGYQYWGQRTRVYASATQAGGFVALPPVSGANPARVLIIAAENCPEAAARRADDLAERLASDGITVTRAHQVSFTLDNGSADDAQRIQAVMNGELPIVIVRGRAKANPTLGEVVAEYRAAGR